MIKLDNLELYTNKGECIAITSYCDTPEKLNTLIETIENVKQYNLPIFLHAHYHIPEGVQGLVDYYFYSSDNPIFDRFNKFWGFTDGYKLEMTEYDFFYTTMKGWDESIKIMCDYDKIHMINYDTNLYPEIFNQVRNSNKSTFIEHNYFGTDGFTPHIFLLYFCLKKIDYNQFRSNITIDKYLKYWELSQSQFLTSIEEIVGSFDWSKFDSEIIPYTDLDFPRMLQSNMSTDARFDFDTLSDAHKGVKMYIGEHNGTTHILFYGIMGEVKVEIFSENITIEKVVRDETLIDVGIPFEPGNVSIYINNTPVKDELIKRFYRLESKIFSI